MNNRFSNSCGALVCSLAVGTTLVVAANNASGATFTFTSDKDRIDFAPGGWEFLGLVQITDRNFALNFSVSMDQGNYGPDISPGNLNLGVYQLNYAGGNIANIKVSDPFNSETETTGWMRLIADVNQNTITFSSGGYANIDDFFVTLSPTNHLQGDSWTDIEKALGSQGSATFVSSSWQNYFTGTGTYDVSSVPAERVLITSLKLDDGGAVIEFTGSPSQVYILQSAAALNATAWSNISTNKATAAGAGSFRDQTAMHQIMRFYRIATRY